MQGIRQTESLLARRRIGAALSAVALIAATTVLATPARAADASMEVATEADLQAAIALANGGEDVTATVVDDIAVTSGLAALTDGSLTLLDDGDGHTISGDGDDFGNWPLIAAAGDVTLTIQGLSFDVADVTSVVMANGWSADEFPTVTIAEVMILADGQSGGVSITNGSLIVSDLTVEGSSGGVFAQTEYGTVSLTDVVVTGSSGCGVAAEVAGSVSFTASGLAISGAECSGIGLVMQGDSSVSITDSYLSGNQGGLEIMNLSTGTALIADSTIVGSNAAPQLEAFAYAGSIIVSSTTISGGRDIGAPHVIAIIEDGGFTLEHSTVTDNAVSGGIPVVAIGGCGCESGGSASVQHTIIAGNVGTSNDSPDFEIGEGFPRAIDWSLVGIIDIDDDPTLEALIAGTGTRFGLGEPIDPKLAPLALNGGMIPNHLPAPDSPAVNTGDPDFAGPPDTDQRGAARISAAIIDIGSVEVQFDPVLSVARSSVAVGEQVTVTGTGFPPDLTLDMVLNSDPVTLGTAVTAADGTLSFGFTVPSTIPVGEHTITAVVDDRVLSSVALTVTGLPDSGLDVGPLTAIGGLCLLLGFGAVLLARRRFA